MLFAFFSLQWLSTFLGHFTTIPASDFPLFLFSVPISSPFFLYKISLCLSYDVVMWHSRNTQISSIISPISRYLITFAKIIFPYKAMYTGSMDQDLISWHGHYSSYYRKSSQLTQDERFSIVWLMVAYDVSKYCFSIN